MVWIVWFFVWFMKLEMTTLWKLVHLYSLYRLYFILTPNVTRPICQVILAVLLSYILS